MPDLLELVARHPAGAHRIAAIVSIAGAANGSLLADDLQSAYRAWLSSFRLLSCAPGTGEEIDDVRREVRSSGGDGTGLRSRCRCSPS